MQLRAIITVLIVLVLLGIFITLAIFLTLPKKNLGMFTPSSRQITEEKEVEFTKKSPEVIVPEEKPLPAHVHLVVPFTSQAPLQEWSDPRQQDACEESTALMAMKWAKEETIVSKLAAKEELLSIAEYQTKQYGDSRDTSAEDSLKRIINGYYNYSNALVKESVTKDDILKELGNGNLVITPMNGRALNNPRFTPPGPERHMVLVIGYDLETEEFITNDPGISQGKDYRYPFATFMKAIRNYETGYHLPIVGEEKIMIVVSKEAS